MHKFAVLDTETSGLFDFSKPADDPSQPRLASITLLYPSADLLTIDREFTRLVKPDGWVLSDEAAAVNGLTMDRLEADGVPVADILDEYEAVVRANHVIAAYNAQYDLKQMRGELRRAGRDDLFHDTPNTCLMRAMTPICRILKANCRTDDDWKFPKLSEALAHIGIPQIEAHTARGDAIGALEVLRYLVRENALIEPGVHLKKAGKPKPAGRRSAKPAPIAATDEIPS